MKYIDPYELLGLQVHAPVEVDRPMLYHARKKLLANFQLAENGMLAWQGEEIGLSQALALADQMEDGSLRLHYWRIRQSTAVISFLREGRIMPTLGMEMLGLRLTKGCYDLVEPYWIPAISDALRSAIDRQQPQDSKQALALVREAHLEDVAEVWKGVLQWANLQAAEMKAATQGLETMVAAAKFEEYANATVCEILNHLPERLSRICDEYATALVHLAWDYHEATKMLDVAWKAVKAIRPLRLTGRTNNALRPIIERMRVLAINLDRKAAFDDIHAQLGNIPPVTIDPSQQPEGSGRGLATALSVVACILVALLALTRLGGGGGRSGGSIRDMPFKMPDLNYDPYGFQRLRNETQGRGNSAGRLYDRLWLLKTGPQVDRKGSADRPENGEAVYGSHTFPQLFHPQKLVIQNRSNKDIVLMVEEADGHELVHAVYLRSKGDTIQIDLALQTYYFRVYTGKNWVASLGELDQHILPGFAKDVDFVGSHPDIYDEKHPRKAPMIFKSMSRLPDGHDMNRLVFDGKVLKWGW